MLEYYLQVQFGGGQYKWKTFSHNGVLFPPEYVQQFIPVLYNNKKITLSKQAEEVAMLYAKYIDTEYVKNKIFNKNFWNDWKKILGSSHEIQNLEDCNFSLMHGHIIDMQEQSKQHKKTKTTKTEDKQNKFKIALVDGKEQPVGNYRIEPPGIFIGRGCNPKLGKLKKRIYPEDITINIDKISPIPKCPTNHKWKNVIHDRTVEWLAQWKDDITGKMKYVWLGAHSDFKTTNDQNKFNLARKLKRKIKSIINENNINLKNSDPKIKQIATALYFIDKLALRVGNEKNEDESDTVGVTNLRIEHIYLPNTNEILFDFLGKDSIRYKRKVKIDSIVFKNLQDYVKNKNKDDDLFDLISATDINKYLQTFMKGLTAKVFRTFNASHLFQKEITKIINKYKNKITNDSTNIMSILMDEYSKANAKVAILCNHQKNVNKSFKSQVENLDKSIKKIKSNLKKAKSAKTVNKTKIASLNDKLSKIKSKHNLKMQLKNIALGTSKINYIDPRITVSFMKLFNLPIEQVFSKTLQEKFKWAFDIDSNFKF